MRMTDYHYETKYYQDLGRTFLNHGWDNEVADKSFTSFASDLLLVKKSKNDGVWKVLIPILMTVGDDPRRLEHRHHPATVVVHARAGADCVPVRGDDN